MKCAIDNCKRDAAPTIRGIVHALCADHERRSLRTSWHEQAAAGVLRTSVVGGIPTTSPSGKPR